MTRDTQDHDTERPAAGALETRRSSAGALGGISRREFLALMGASMALASGLEGCVRKPPREVVSWDYAPEYQEPGKVLHFASTWMDGGYPYGLLVTAVDGRPIKIEGNPEHPVGGASSNMAMQAAILGLYDPGRMRRPLGAADWSEADKRVRESLEKAKSGVVLTRATLGESERALMAEFIGRYPALRHFVFEPVNDAARRRAWEAIYGQPGEWLPRYDKARVILSVGCDFLGSDGVELEATGQFASRGFTEAPVSTIPQMTRLYVAESAVSLTGTNADHRLRIRPSQALDLLRAIRKGVAGQDMAADAERLGLDAGLLKALTSDLKEIGRAHV